MANKSLKKNSEKFYETFLINCANLSQTFPLQSDSEFQHCRRLTEYKTPLNFLNSKQNYLTEWSGINAMKLQSPLAVIKCFRLAVFIARMPLNFSLATSKLHLLLFRLILLSTIVLSLQFNSRQFFSCINYCGLGSAD